MGERKHTPEFTSREVCMVSLEYLNGVEEVRASIESVARIMREAGHGEQAKMLQRWHSQLFDLRSTLAKSPTADEERR